MKTIQQIESLRQKYVDDGNYNYLPPDAECSKLQLSQKKKRNKEFEFFKFCKLALSNYTEHQLINQRNQLKVKYQHINDRVISKRISIAEYRELVREKNKRLKKIKEQVKLIDFLLE